MSMKTVSYFQKAIIGVKLCSYFACLMLSLLMFQGYPSELHHAPPSAIIYQLPRSNDSVSFLATITPLRSHMFLSRTEMTFLFVYRQLFTNPITYLAPGVFDGLVALPKLFVLSDTELS
jgi:hypothetical protein